MGYLPPQLIKGWLLVGRIDHLQLPLAVSPDLIIHFRLLIRYRNKIAELAEHFDSVLLLYDHSFFIYKTFITTDPVDVCSLLSWVPWQNDFVDDTLSSDLPVSRRLYLEWPGTMSPRMQASTEPPSIRPFTCDRYTNCVRLHSSLSCRGAAATAATRYQLYLIFSTMCYVLIIN